MFCDRGQCLISSEKVMPELSKDLKEFLKQYPSIEVIDEGLKVKTHLYMYPNHTTEKIEKDGSIYYER